MTTINCEIFKEDQCKKISDEIKNSNQPIDLTLSCTPKKETRNIGKIQKKSKMQEGQKPSLSIEEICLLLKTPNIHTLNLTGSWPEIWSEDDLIEFCDALTQSSITKLTLSSDSKALPLPYMECINAAIEQMEKLEHLVIGKGIIPTIENYQFTTENGEYKKIHIKFSQSIQESKIKCLEIPSNCIEGNYSPYTVGRGDDGSAYRIWDKYLTSSKNLLTIIFTDPTKNYSDNYKYLNKHLLTSPKKAILKLQYECENKRPEGVSDAIDYLEEITECDRYDNYNPLKWKINALSSENFDICIDALIQSIFTVDLDYTKYKNILTAIQKTEPKKFEAFITKIISKNPPEKAFHRIFNILYEFKKIDLKFIDALQSKNTKIALLDFLITTDEKLIKKLIEDNSFKSINELSEALLSTGSANYLKMLESIKNKNALLNPLYQALKNGAYTQDDVQKILEVLFNNAKDSDILSLMRESNDKKIKIEIVKFYFNSKIKTENEDLLKIIKDIIQETDEEKFLILCKDNASKFDEVCSSLINHLLERNKNKLILEKIETANLDKNSSVFLENINYFLSEYSKNKHYSLNSTEISCLTASLINSFSFQEVSAEDYRPILKLIQEKYPEKLKNILDALYYSFINGDFESSTKKQQNFLEILCEFKKIDVVKLMQETKNKPTRIGMLLYYLEHKIKTKDELLSQKITTVIQNGVMDLEDNLLELNKHCKTRTSSYNFFYDLTPHKTCISLIEAVNISEGKELKNTNDNN